MDISAFLIFVAVLSVGVAIIIFLEAADLGGLSLRDALKEYWHLYFGGGEDDLPPGERLPLEDPPENDTNQEDDESSV